VFVEPLCLCCALFVALCLFHFTVRFVCFTSLFAFLSFPFHLPFLILLFFQTQQSSPAFAPT
jgi:hypothetical protein